MNHEHAEELIGAYALDAVSDEEARSIEAHLEECPRCAAELDSYRAAAAMIGNIGATPPEGLWTKIESELSSARPPIPGHSRLAKRTGSAPLVLWRGVAAAATLVAAAVLIVFAVEIGTLHSQVNRLSNALGRRNLSAAVVAAEAGPHSTIRLASAGGNANVTLLVARSHEAYWVSSTLPKLTRRETYQLWGLTDGRLVSLGLAGNDPHTYSLFRLSGHFSRLMVTVEPAGGTSRPTTPVVAARQL